MLLNNLYTYEQLEGDSISALRFRIYIRANHPIFTGHFPGNPITPGVCQMEMVKEIFSDYLGRPLFLNSISDMKFINIWVPDDSEPVYLDLAAIAEDEAYKIRASISTIKEVYFKMRGNIHVCG